MAKGAEIAMKHFIKIVLVLTCMALMGALMAVPANATPGAGTCEVVPAGFGLTEPDRQILYQATAQCSGAFIDEVGVAVYQVNGTAQAWKGSYTHAFVNGEVTATTSLQQLTGSLAYLPVGQYKIFGWVYWYFNETRYLTTAEFHFTES